MFKRKFIDRLRDKYQTGGYKNPLINSYKAPEFQEGDGKIKLHHLD